MTGYITATELYKTDAGSSDASVPLDPPELVDTWGGDPVETVAQYVPLLDVERRPAAWLWGAYEVRHQVAAYCKVFVRGVLPPSGALVLLVQVWRSRADFDAGQAPAIKTTFVHQVTDTLGADASADVRRLIEAYLVRASFRSVPQDDTDPSVLDRVSTNPLDDRYGLLADPNVMLIDQSAVDLG